MKRISSIGLFCLIEIFSPMAEASEVIGHPAGIIYEKLNEVTKMREALASTLDGKKSPVTIEDFKRVCAPVGAELKSWAAQKGFRIRQVSTKFRNPDNRPTEIEKEAILKFATDRSMERLEIRDSKSKPPGIMYFAPIEVKASCLACHGEALKRPNFIVKKYQTDLAHTFKPGDLRGIYSVFVPGAAY